MINVVEIPDPSDSSEFAQMGLIVPVPAPEANTIVMEPRDGRQVQRLTASAVEFKIGRQTKFKDQKVKIELFVTEARFALACSKYDKGGGHRFFGGGGALALDVAFNSVSKIRAKVRSRGKMLVGQVRYPWLRRVGSTPKTGFGTHEKLYLETNVKGSGTTLLTLVLPNNVDAAQVAAEIARRAARYQLATADLLGDSQQALEAVAAATPLAAGANPKEISWHALPGARGVDEESARLTPAAA
jgi:hypothetical protein